MTPDASFSPLPPKHADSESRWFVRLLITFLLGFGLPVVACYGLIVASAVGLQILFLGANSTPSLSTSGAGSGPAVALIPVQGVIISGEANAFTAATDVAFSKTVISNIEKANDDPDIKALVLTVNSPGGGVVASDEIYHALEGVDKPVIVVIGDLGASGAYYISMASDWILANPNSLVGSIGVISEFPNAEGLLEKVGVDFVVVTSGPRKDFGSPYREMTADEQEYWQVIVDETYDSFVQIVAEGRGLTAEEVKPLADGGVFSGRQALELKLIDQLGYEDDAIKKAAELGGISGEPRIVEYNNQPDFFSLLSQSVAGRSLVPSLAELMNTLGHPTLSVRWIGP